jgi:hypothetical protein
MALTKIGIDAISGAIQTSNIEDGAVTSAKIATGGVATIDMADGSVTSLKIADGGIATGDIADSAVTTAKINNSAVTTGKINDAAVTTAKVNDSAITVAKTAFGSSTAAINLPAGTTAQRPESPTAGMVRYNSDNSSLEFYDGTTWISTNLVPYINSITGTVWAGAVSSLTLSIANASESVTVRFAEAGTLLKDVTGVSVSAGSASVTVPSEVYGQTAGDTVSITVINQDGTPASNSIDKTVVGLPTGGTAVTASGYRYNTFTSSSNFVAPTNFSKTVEYLIVAGGGGSTGTGPTGTYPQAWGGGGGAGGLLQSSIAVTAGTYAVVVGAGGGTSTSGSSSSVFGISTVGGGKGGDYSQPGTAGGSGGGGGGDIQQPGGAGTAGQGNAGGASKDLTPESGGGGGGAGAVGNAGYGDGTGAGGIGRQFSAWATATSTGADSGYYAGGGGGGIGTGGGYDSSLPNLGGLGGGGRGAYTAYNSGNNTAANGTANTGGGAGGGNRTGGSGIVITRFAL